MNRKTDTNKRKKGKDKHIEKKKKFGKFNAKSIRIEQKKKEKEKKVKK